MKQGRDKAVRLQHAGKDCYVAARLSSLRKLCRQAIAGKALQAGQGIAGRAGHCRQGRALQAGQHIPGDCRQGSNMSMPSPQ